MKSIQIAALVVLATSTLAHADDWPHWMGPTRDNVWSETGIVSRFPEGGPKVLWRAPVAGGYSGPSVSNGRVYITDYVTEDNVKVDNFQRDRFTGVERVLCLDEKSGKPIWSYEYAVEYSISYPAGPRCTPIVDDGKLYTLGAEGNLYCFDATSGEIIWQKPLKQIYGVKAALWGYAAHPLIDGDKLITLVGGEQTHAVAFDKNTGEEVWRSRSSNPSMQGYAPPTIIEAGGVRQLILAKPDEVASVDPETGKPFWSVPYEATNGSIIMTPIQAGNYLFVAGYSNKSVLLRLGRNKPSAEVVWQDKKREAISPVNVQPFLDGKTLYGMGQKGLTMAVDVESGKRLWSTGWPLGKRPQQTATAFIVRQADRYWLFTEKGELVIAQLTRAGHKEIDRTKIIQPTNVAFGREVVWCAPAYANKHLYVRNDRECICIDLEAKAGS